MPIAKRSPAATPEQVVSARGHRTQEAVAKLLGVSVNTIQNWEHGRSPISRAHYLMLLMLEDAPCPTA